MPKYKIACFLLAAVLAAVGTVLVVKNLTGGYIPDFEKPTEDPNTYLDRTDDIVIDDKSADPRQFLFVAHKVLLDGKGFYGVAEGTSTAMGISQNVRNTRYVVGEFGNKSVLKEMVTKGVVSKAYQLYMEDNNYIYRKSAKISSLRDVTWEKTAQAFSESAFYSNFGHRNDKLTGYILNWDTVKSGELVGQKDGVYTFRYVLDPDTASTYLRREMIFNGGLSGEPSFSKCVIYVAMDSDFNVKSLRTDCEYKAKTMGINAGLTEDITEVFTPYEGELPEREFFEQYFTETPGDDIEHEQTALDVLMEMFSPYLGGEALQVAIEASANGENIASGLLSIDGLDISDLSKLTVNAQIGNLDLAYEHGNGAIYLKYKDFQASTTVNGVKELVSMLAPLFGDKATGSLALDDFDVESLLNDLTYEVTDNDVVVRLPVTLGGLTIDAKLNGKVDGESYKFTNAVIRIGDVEITITPNAWTVAERSGAYPEILGIVDILQNGKIALNANLTIGKYEVGADILVDLAKGNVQLNAELGHNGSVNVVYVDGVAYLTFGEVKVQLDTANIGELLDVIYKYTGIELAAVTPSINLSAQSILSLLSSINTNNTNGGVDFSLSVAGVDLTLRLANTDGTWNIDSITVSADGIYAQVVPADALGEVTAPNSNDYADITDIIETFAEPIANAINGVYGASFNATLTLGSKQYDVKGNVKVDLNKTLKLNVTLYDGSVGIIDAEVIYANNTVFLTLNGIKVAFAVGGGSSDIDIVAKLSELLNNAQIKDIIDSHEQLQQLVEQAKALISVATNFTLADLLDVDFTTVITQFSFNNGELRVTLDGTAFGLSGLELDIAVRNVDNSLAVQVSGLKVANVGLDIGAVLINTAENIVVPDTSAYMLKLAGDILGAELQLTADLVHMDIWASVRYGEEEMFVRFVDGKVYVQYGKVKVVLNTAELDAIISKISKLVGSLPETGSFDMNTVLAVLSAIKSDLTGETPNISLGVNDVSVRINFTSVKDETDLSRSKLVFDNISVGFTLNGQQQVATVSQQTQQAKQLDVTGEFVDGNALIDVILDTVIAFRDNNGIEANLSLVLTVDGVKYDADITLNYNGGLYVKAVLRQGGKAVVSAEIYLVDGTLYFDVNGIRQAIELPEMSGELDVAAILGAIDQLKGINDKIDSLIEYAKRLPESLEGIVFSQIINEFTFVDNVIGLKLDLAQLNLGEVTLKLGMGNALTVDVDGRAANVNYKAGITLHNSSNKVVAPQLDSYVTELKVALGDDICAIIKLDLYHNTIVGKAVVYGQTLNFKYVNGVVYATYGSQGVVGIKLNLDDIDVLIEAISRFVELPQISLGGSDNIAETIMGIIESISFVRHYTDDGYVLEVGYGSVAVSVKFVATADEVTLANVEVNAGELTVTAQQVHGEVYPVVAQNGNYVDVAQLLSALAEPVSELINADGYAIGVDGSIALSGRVYSINATVQINSNVHVEFDLSYQGVRMIDGQLWIVDNVLYLEAGDIRFAISLGEKTNDDVTLEKIKDTLNSAMGYNSYVDEIVELVLNILDTPVNQIDFEQLLSSLTYNNDNVTLGVNGEQFGLNSFTLGLNTNNGLNVYVKGLNYKDITVNINNANIVAYSNEITKPDGDFSTNIVVDIQVDEKSNTSGEHNKIYANIDLLKGVVLIRIETTMRDGATTHLDAQYLIESKVLKLTNGKNLNVLVNINNIASIVKRINDIVNEYAGAGDQALPDIFGKLSGDVDLKSIVKSLFISNSSRNIVVGAKALGFDITASFYRGLNSITIPVDFIESKLVVSFDGTTKAKYATFSDNNNDYVSVDKVFDDFYYGESGESGYGPIYNLVHTNSWKFDFMSDSEIDVKNDDGTTTKYQIIAGSYIAFYYLKASPEQWRDAEFNIRANITVRKDGGEFLYLDIAFINGRIYATYDSRKTGNKNELKATVSLDAIKDCIDLLPALINVVPQIGTLIDDVKSALNNAQGKMTLGNVSQIIESVSYVDRRFTLEINGRAIDANKFDREPITLRVSEYGTEGLKLEQLTLGYDKVSVNLENIVVTGSQKIGNTDEFEYVRDYIESYFTEHGDINSHMNFDSIRELLSAFIITADNVDENGNRSFAIEGTINAKLLGNQAIIGITIYVDIDKDNNVYLAVKLSRDAKGVLSGAIYADDGGYSYMLLNGKEGTISLYRNSYKNYTYCSRCGNWNCTNTVLHLAWRKSYSYLDTEAPVGNQLPSFMIENMPLSEFTADTKTMVGYILDTINLGNLIDSQIRKAIGKENNNVYGIEDIFKSYTYTYIEATETGTFALKADLSPIDSALGVITANIVHVGDFDKVGYDEDGNFSDGGVKLTKINGTAEMIEIMNATYELTLIEPTNELAYWYVTNNIYVW